MGQWVTGQSGNLLGRPRKGKSESDKLRNAIARVAKKHNINFYEAFAEMALVEPSVMIALMRKIHPDLKAVQSTVDLTENYGVIVLPAKLPMGEPCMDHELDISNIEDINENKTKVMIDIEPT